MPRLATQAQSIFRKNRRRLSQGIYYLLDALRSAVGLYKPVAVNAPSGSLVVLFVGDLLAARLARLAKWLQRTADIHCVLITSVEGAHGAFGIEHFAEVHTYRSYPQLRAFCSSLRGVDIVHAFGPKSYAVRLVMESTSVPVVLDVQDLYVTNYRLHPPVMYMKMDLPHEKFVLSNANGVISQSHEAYFARVVYRTPKIPSLFFPVYCDDDQVVNVDRKLEFDDIHIVYAGRIYGSTADHGLFGNMQFFKLAESFRQQRLNFHVFPSPAVPLEVVREYQHLDGVNPFFHLHATLPQDELALALSKFHFGILPFFNTGTDRDVAKREYSTSLKLFNYLEADLPVIISRDMSFQCWLAKRFGARILVDGESIERVRSIIEETNYQKMLDDLRERRKKGLISAQIGRLIDFYGRCRMNARPEDV